MRPLGAAGQAVVVGVARDEVDRQLAADDQLLEVGVHVFPGRVAARDGQRDRQGADVAEMQVGR